jgi:hypothetical protein
MQRDVPTRHATCGVQTDWRSTKYLVDTGAVKGIRVGLLPVTEASKECTGTLAPSEQVTSSPLAAAQCTCVPVYSGVVNVP